MDVAPQKSLMRKIRNTMDEIGLIDVWRDFYPSSRDYTHYSAPHSPYSRLDNFIFLNKDRYKVKTRNIGRIDLSDHSPIYLTVCL